MKKALSYKISLLFITLVLSLAFAFAFYGARTVSAENITNGNITNYFGGAEKVELTGGSLVATVKNGGSVVVKNKLVVDDLAITLDIPDTVTGFKVTLTYDSYYASGAYKDGEFHAEINNEFDFAVKGENTVVIKTVNNVLFAKIDGGEFASKDEVYYKIKGADKCSAIVKFDFTLAENTENADITFKSIDQMQSDISGTYKQTFALDTENEKIATFAKPRVSIDNLPVIKDDTGKLKVIYGKYYTFSFTVYSVFGDVKSNSVYIKKDAKIGGTDAWLDNADNPKSIAFKNDTDETEFSVCTGTGTVVELEKFKVLQAVEYTADEKAPEYISYADNQAVYDGYRELVKKAAEKDYGEDDVEDVHSIRLGDSYEIPSLQDLVFDDYCKYSDLTYTVYYKTPSNASGSTSSLKFTVSEAGEYEFYVVFKDANGNAMEKDDFYTVDEHDGQLLTPQTYFNSVFRFTVNDDAPMSVTVTSSQGEGFLNTKYTATPFKIKSSGYNVNYTLYYNASANADVNGEGWVEIPRLSAVAENYNENGFTYVDIEKIDYDGEYSFTPVKKGVYRIDCYITSDKSERHAEGSTLISVTKEQTVVKVDTHWLRNNIWSVVFLSIGTLSLIGIIVLLFIKPKEEIETDETGDALKLNPKK